MQRPIFGPTSFLGGLDISEEPYEDYVVSLHGFPRESGVSNMSLADNQSVNRLHGNLGGLLYFSLYNLLNKNKSIRIRSLIFVKQLFVTFKTDANFNVDGFFASYMGAFYSNVGMHLQAKAREIARCAAFLFPGEASGYMWEAVRCFRTTPRAEDQFIILSPLVWIFELIEPFCRY